MSDDELIRKFYYGSYQINSKGYLACPLYDERKNEDNQICSFYIQNQSADLTDEEFACFWSHVQNVHPDTYLDILKLCRSKIPNISKNNQGDKIYDLIASTNGNLHKLTASWLFTNMNSVEFLSQFKSELESLEKKVNELVTPLIQVNVNPNPNTTSLPHL